MKIENVSSLLKLHDKRKPVYKRQSPYFRRCMSEISDIFSGDVG